MTKGACGNFFTRRYTNGISVKMAGANQQVGTPEIFPDDITSFNDRHEFTVSGRRFVIERLWAGETLDSVAVWLPEQQTVFTGNWAGAIHGAMPNFYTARGDRQRSLPGWLVQCDARLAREPELLITGHEQPISGKDRIRAELGKVRDAVRHLHNETVRGMDEGRTLSEMMAQICLPAELQLRDGRSRERWVVRAVYEEYAGWFRHERTSELYASSQSEIWPDIVAGLGGAETVAAMASQALAKGDAERALHFIEMATHVAPDSVRVREVEIAVLETLANASGLHAFDLLGWLEGRIAIACRVVAQ
ncbi:alkyl sulfatase dimerization domain-containing protein [Sphingobium xenophagum]|uniref:alkyl sulfatase dimerization domain-containing protein n=1 Tax=Sphingobium xenophagum TaxID=121428 RepID=UPI00286A6661|nr:alkyl sulfatase dimerization domain-containing protein [Sphingobium xenophagum]